MKTWAVILAAGCSSRLRAQGVETPKQFLCWEGVPLYWHSARVLASYPALQGIVFVFPAENGTLSHTAKLRDCVRNLSTPFCWRVAQGGERRQDSVYNGLLALPPECTHVLIHDAARPFVTVGLIDRVFCSLQQGWAGVVPVVPVTDTVKSVDNESRVARTIPRQALRAAQTPQGFSLAVLREAHVLAARHEWEVTDDASMLEQAGVGVICVPGETTNSKLTWREDLEMLQSGGSGETGFACTGFGYDVHRFGGENSLVLGGVPIASPLTVDAHSDGDVVLHALIDGLLGCLCLGDIGTFFPDSDPAYKGISSGILLAEVLEIAARKRLRIDHVDITIVTQVPRIGPHRAAIAANLAKLIALPSHKISVKATTEEKLGFTGEKKGIKAIAIVTGYRFETE